MTKRGCCAIGGYVRIIRSHRNHGKIVAVRQSEIVRDWVLSSVSLLGIRLLTAFGEVKSLINIIENDKNNLFCYFIVLKQQESSKII